MKKVGIYCRISKDSGKEETSIEMQKQYGIEFCNKNNYDYKIYIDKGISGTSDDRPQFQELLLDIGLLNIHIIWVYDDSRIQRSPVIRYQLKTLMDDFNVQYCTHVDGFIEPTPENELMGGLKSAFNQYYVQLTKRKIKDKLKLRIKSGRGWGIPPYGYTYDVNGYFVLDPIEKEIVVKIFNMSLAGDGTEKIAKWLNAENIKTRYNNYAGSIKYKDKKTKQIPKEKIKWSGNSVRGIIKNPMFYGKKQINDSVINVEALFDYTYWQEVNTNLSSNNRNTYNIGGKLKYEYLLNGIIDCGKCGSNYNGKTRMDKKDHFYYCMSKRSKGQNCKNRSIGIDVIEELIKRTLFEDQRIYNYIKDQYSNNKSTTLSNIKTKQDELKKLLTGKTNLIRSIEDGILLKEEVKERLIEIREEQIKIESEINLLNASLKFTAENEISNLQIGYDNFAKLDFQQQKELIRKFVKSITIRWIEEDFNSIKIRYYLVKIVYAVGGITDYLVNGYGLDMNTWFNILYDPEEGKNYFDICYQNNKSKYRWGRAQSIDEESEVWDELTTLVPYNLITSWQENELISFYGKERYYKYKAEFEHKRELDFKKLFYSTT